MMTLFWKGAAALSLAVAGLGAAAVPAQAQYYGGYGSNYRDGWRGDRGDRWDNRRGWRDNRRGWRGHQSYRGHRQRCWTEWRYSHYRDRRVRVRVCR
jgi:hypothetical protein